METRKNTLNDKDIVNFNDVPAFIVHSFFGKCDYKNRLLVLTFCYLNDIAIDQIFDLIQWNECSKKDKDKIRHLYSYFELDRYREKYYSYNVQRRMVMYLNGDLRRFGCRVPQNQH